MWGKPPLTDPRGQTKMSKRLRDYNSALKYGAKIYPEDLAGMIGLPFVSNVFYVDPNSGNDNNPGTSSNNQKKAIGTATTGALATATANQHDVIVINPTGGTGRTSESVAIDWNKRFTHLVGNAAPLVQDNRAGIGFATGGSLVISENGCLFKNLTMFSSADIDETVSVTGDYNSFQGVDFKGTSHATSIGSTPWRALNLDGAEENYFGGCAIGGDTYTRSAANTSLELENAATRNVFEDCFFPIHTDDAAATFVLADAASDIDRFVWFKNCVFHNADKSASTTMTVAMTVHAAVGGSVILDGCAVNGATDWANDYTAVMGCNMPDITAANAGFMEQIAS